ncbi:MAG: hypothetical protein IJ320_04420 [Phascolarctobacterium sp.]|nr:hypothetical protein [Phascolarctobacterium sp.]
MRKFLLCIITFVIMLSIVGCGGNEKKKNDDPLYLKSIAILDEFKDDNRIKDFRKGYDLLTTLPNDQDDLISQLDKVNGIYQKYNKKIDYGAILLHDAKYGHKISKNRIEDYRKDSAYRDAEKLMELLVFPALMEKYGSEVQSIKGLKYGRILNAMIANWDSRRLKQKSDFMFRSEEWQCFNRTGIESRYNFRYYTNGLVEWIKFPLVVSNERFGEKYFKAFWQATPEARKELLTKHIVKLAPNINLFNQGYDILRHIYTDEEITVLNNYLHSLSIDDIWKNDIFHNIALEKSEKPTYATVTIPIDYKGNLLNVSYGIDNITLSIHGKNKVNPFSNRWDTLLCGLIYPGNKNWQESYKDTISNNISANNNIKKYYVDLNANAEKYVQKDNSKSVAECNIILSTKFYDIKIPDSWKTDCIYEIVEDKNSSYTLTCYEKNSRKKFNGGELFSIKTLPVSEDYSYFPEFDFLGSFKVNGIGEFNMLVLYPSDVQFNKETVYKYNEMKEYIPAIVKTISFKDGCLFTKAPPKK